MIDEAKLRRLQKGVWVAAAASLGVFLVLIGLSASRLSTLHRQVAAAEQDLLQRSHDLEAKEKELREKQAELKEIDSKLKLLRDLYAKMAQESPGLARRATESVLETDPQAAEILPRVYIHIRREDQRGSAAALGRALEQAGFVIPGVERLVELGPSASELRYFRRVEREEEDAKLAASVLRDAGVPLDPKYVAGFESSTQIRARHYELWLAPDFPAEQP